MKKNSATVLVLLALMASHAILSGQTAQDRIRQGDEFYAQFNDAKALEEYRAALQIEPQNYEALWKTARALVDVADALAPADKAAKDKQFKTYQDAEKYARQAVQANPGDVWGHFMIASSIGKKVLTQGKKEQIAAAKEVKKEIDKAIELNPSHDLAYHALGRWHRRMAEIGGAKRLIGGILYGGIPKGTFEESEKYLKKAIELKPEYGNHHLELGRTYLVMDRTGMAAGEFQKCIDSPVITSKCQIYKKEAEAEIEKLNKKK